MAIGLGWPWRMLRAVGRARWNLVRFGLALFVLWVIAGDTGARLARLQLSQLPTPDWAGEVRSLRMSGRFGEAIMLAESAAEGAPPDARAAIDRERELAVTERDSWLRRAKDVGAGALTGRGDSLESLLGAIGADFFVVGDLRDLTIEGTKQIFDGDSDEVILALSALGVLTTVAPQIDWVPSILKGAKRMGAVSKKLGGVLVEAAKARDLKRVEPLFKDVKAISEAASPGGAVRILRHADDEKEVAKLAEFVTANRRGAFALHATGDVGAGLVKEGAGVEKIVLKAASKGRAGAAFLKKPIARMLLRPHPLLGIAKAIYKGNAEKLVSRLVDLVDPRAWWMIPLAAAWAWIEMVFLIRRMAGGRRHAPP